MCHDDERAAAVIAHTVLQELHMQLADVPLYHCLIGRHPYFSSFWVHKAINAQLVRDS